MAHITPHTNTTANTAPTTIPANTGTSNKPKRRLGVVAAPPVVGRSVLLLLPVPPPLLPPPPPPPPVPPPPVPVLVVPECGRE